MSCRFASTLLPNALVALLTTAAVARAQEFPLTETKGLVSKNVQAEAVDVLGRQAVRLITVPEQEDGFAFLPGVDFQDGTIEADIALKITTTPGQVKARLAGWLDGGSGKGRMTIETRADGRWTATKAP